MCSVASAAPQPYPLSMSKAPGKQRLDVASTLTLVVTVLLFASALFETGLPHDLSLEVGVFLVSLKLVFASHRARLTQDDIEAKLDRLMELQRAPPGRESLNLSGPRAVDGNAQPGDPPR